MLPTEQERFFDAITYALGEYSKEPTEGELGLWWAACKGFSLADVERALKAYATNPENRRPPRPIDVKHGISPRDKDASHCSATDPTGRCEYPGIFSDGTAGEGPWYCPWHRTERAGPEASAWIERSRNIPYEVARAKRVERMGTEAQRAPAVIATAWDMAHHGRNAPKRGDFADLPLPPHLEQTGTE